MGEGMDGEGWENGLNGEEGRTGRGRWRHTLTKRFLRGSGSGGREGCGGRVRCGEREGCGGRVR